VQRGISPEFAILFFPTRVPLVRGCLLIFSLCLLKIWVVGENFGFFGNDLGAGNARVNHCTELFDHKIADHDTAEDEQGITHEKLEGNGIVGFVDDSHFKKFDTYVDDRYDGCDEENIH